MNKKFVYVASPLFSASEKEYNRKIWDALKGQFEVFLPQVHGGLMEDQIRQGIPEDVAAARIFDIDVSAIKRCDILLINMDGRSIDEGAAFELGVAYSLGKQCIGLKTDPRRLLVTGDNPMIESALSRIFRDLDELKAWGQMLHDINGGRKQDMTVH